MKFNLKTQPKRKTPIVWPDPYFCDFYYEILEWLEDFEKELRKHLQAFIDENEWPECSNFSVKKTVKEILGE